jgi:hypothetical protein
MNAQIAAAFHDELQKLALSKKTKSHLKTVAGVGAGMLAAGLIGRQLALAGSKGKAVGRILRETHIKDYGTAGKLPVTPSRVKNAMQPYAPKRELAPNVVPGGAIQTSSEEQKPKKKSNLIALFADDAMMAIKKMLPSKVEPI